MTIEDKVAQLGCQISESPVTNGFMEKGIGGLGCILRTFKARQAALSIRAWSFLYNISIETIKPDQGVTVSVDVENSGLMKGDEVVQLYIHDVIGSVLRPLKELKGFKRITLEPKKKKTVVFDLTPEHFSLYNKARSEFGSDPMMYSQ